MSEFADAFRIARIKSNRTFRQLKDEVGMSIGFWSEMENGKKIPPDISIIKKVEKIFGITDDKLVKLAIRARIKSPSAIGQLIEGRPDLGEALFRLDKLPPDKLEEILQTLRETSEDGDHEPFFLDWDSIRFFDEEVIPF